MKRASILLFVILLSVACSLSPIPVKKTATELLQPTLVSTLEPTVTFTPTVTKTPTKTPTITPTLTPTPDYGQLTADRIKAYNNPDLDYLLEYYKDYPPIVLEDYTDDAALNDNIFSVSMKFKPQIFMVISKIEYQHPDARITKPNAGCGFIFHDNDVDKAYYAIITADSNARLSNLIFKQYIKGVAHHKIRQKPLTSPNGSAEVLIAVMDDRFVMAVDGEVVIDQAIKWDSDGNFGYAISSGTNKGYGTRCIFSDTVIYTDPADYPSWAPNG
jgi:hypothetical protein